MRVEVSMKRLLPSLAGALVLALSQGAPQNAAEPIAVGDPVPAFRLNDHLGSAVEIAPDADATEGSWRVLAFYPKAATPG
jgi:hypothetical protein